VEVAKAKVTMWSRDKIVTTAKKGFDDVVAEESGEHGQQIGTSSCS
jgi:hypothetical protein